MEKDSVTYSDWKTGKKIIYKLNDSYPSENKSGLICPFDNTEIIRWHDHMSKGYECLNCGLDYSSMKANNQEEVNRVAKEHFQNLEKKLEKLKQEQEEINLILNHAAKKELYNKK
jgi:hypothetical protein